MHRTEAAGHSANTYVDRNLPAVAGTVLKAADRNAIQNEICNVIERAGLTLKTEATETGDQLEAVIFDETLTRTNDIVITDGTTTIETDIVTGLARVSSTAFTGRETRIWPEKIELYFDTTANIETEISAEGLKFPPVESSGQVATSPIRTACYSASGMSWTVDSGSGFIYQSGTDVSLSGITWASGINKVISVNLRFKRSGDALPISAPMYCTFKNSSGTLAIEAAAILCASDPDAGTDQQILITYEVP